MIQGEYYVWLRKDFHLKSKTFRNWGEELEILVGPWRQGFLEGMSLGSGENSLFQAKWPLNQTSDTVLVWPEEKMSRWGVTCWSYLRRGPRLILRTAIHCNCFVHVLVHLKTWGETAVTTMLHTAENSRVSAQTVHFHIQIVVFLRSWQTHIAWTLLTGGKHLALRSTVTVHRSQGVCFQLSACIVQT